jgi:chromosome transmission fidelity protein 18
MARILAKMCGYEPLEINASDERTGNQILNRVKTAISRDNHFTNKDESTKKRPVCLIVDEVDGALGSTFDGESSKGIGQIVEYLKKCIAAMN